MSKLLANLPLRTLKQFLRDLFFVILSVVFAVVLIKTPMLETILHQNLGSHELGSFISGIFFTSVFTTAPATVALAEIAKSNSILLTALFGALGALLGDLFIFRFVRDNVAQDFEFLFKEIKKERRWLKLHHRWGELHAFKWLVPLLGAICIASPLPDEIGLTILGLSKMKTWVMALLTFVLNFFGILLIGLVAKAWF